MLTIIKNYCKIVKNNKKIKLSNKIIKKIGGNSNGRKS